MSWHNISYKPQIGNPREAIDLPASKSISNRLLILQYLSEAPFNISNLSDANDTKILKAILNDAPISSDINCQDAGTVLRFLTCLCAIRRNACHSLTGTQRLMERPIQPLLEALTAMGATISFTKNKIEIEGAALENEEIEINGNVSSQFITGLCLVASEIKNGLTLKINEPIYSKPYIQMTLALLNRFGVKSSFENNLIRIEQQKIQGHKLTVEGDWSSACFIYAAMILNHEIDTIQINALGENDIQGDKYIATLGNIFGIKTTFLENDAVLSRITSVKPPNEIFLEDFPDLAIPLITACAFKYPTIIFKGLEHLKHKESNRIEALRHNLAKFGIQLNEDNGCISFKTDSINKKEDTIQIETFQDHRIAMSFALTVSMGYHVQLDDIACIHKSFPTYFDQMIKLGICLES